VTTSQDHDLLRLRVERESASRRSCATCATTHTNRTIEPMTGAASRFENGLTREVLAGWDPETIAVELAAERADLPILREWARNADPARPLPLEPAAGYGRP